MEIREIFETIESDPNMDKELQNDILEKITNIAKADELVDGLEEKIEQHKDELSEKELKYIINKCISYKSVFYRFRNGGIVDYDQLNEITRRIFELEESIRKNDFHVWKEELLAYRGSKKDKEEDKMLKNMLMVVPEETNVVEKITRMFRRTLWKVQQKAKQKKEVQTDKVINLPQNNIDISLHDFEERDKVQEEQIEEREYDIPGFEEEIEVEDKKDNNNDNQEK
ncbi:MAG: hypothetical protein J6A15_09820 [Clostridia bacterium]|nr:hypothetical protein [Clostridia bacterium]